MRVDRVVLKNFRSHEFADISFELPVTIIHGRNAAGKSSIIDAIHFGLLGYCRGTDERGAGVKELIGEHGKAAEISLETTGGDGAGYEIGTHVPVNVAINGSGARWPMGGQVLPAVAARASVAASLGFDRDALHACLDVHGFLGLHHARQKDLLLKALGVDLADFDAKYEEAKSTRAGLKRSVSLLVSPPIPADPGYTVAQVDEQLTDLRAQLEALVDERGRTVGAAEQIAAEVQELEGRLQAAPSKAATAKARKEAEKLRDAIESLCQAAAGIEKREADLLAQNKALCEERTKLEISLKRGTILLEGEAASYAEQRDAYVAAAEAVNKMSGACLVSGEIPCKIDQAGREALVRHFEAAIAERNKKIAAWTEAVVLTRTARVKAITDQTAGIQQELAEVRAGAGMSSLPERERELKAAEKVVAAGEAVEEGRVRLAELKAKVGEFVGIGKSGEIDSAIVTLKARISHGTQLRTQVSDRDTVVRLARDREEHRSTMQKQLDQAEAACLKYGPNGERAGLMSAALGPLLAAAGEVVTLLGLPGVEITVDSWRIGIPGRDAELLSTSEQMRLALALQIALARATGIGLVAFDGAEILDGEGRAGLAGVAASGLVEQLIICATTDDEFEAPEIPNVQFVRVGTPELEEVCA